MLWDKNGRSSESQEKALQATEKEPNGKSESLAISSTHNSYQPSQNATEDHFCKEHGVAFQRYEQDGRSWYSHKTRDGWCKEK